MPPKREPPPAYLRDIERLAKVTSGGNSERTIQGEVAAVLAAWTRELAEDRSTFRDRVNELEEGLSSQLEAVKEQLDDMAAADKGLANRQVEALTAALAALRAAQDRLGA